uniref:EF-hand domain-containing protein n=1 Tax=Erpetoichthys calabaricus TaxID=27687 RepID=A0A8C4SPY2_ERPCA
AACSAKQFQYFYTCNLFFWLAGSLQLDFKDLQVVFDHLDHERHGFVTTEDFLKGLSEWSHQNFLGKQPQLKDMQKKKEPSLYQSPSPDFLEEVDSEEKKHFLTLMESLGADNLLQDQTEIWKLWMELRYREPHLLGNLEEFVAKVTLQIRQAQEEKESLELTLKKIVDHNQEVQHLYEEMEHQIIQERERLRSEASFQGLLGLCTLAGCFQQIFQGVQTLTQRSSLIFVIRDLKHRRLKPSI